MTLQQDFTTTGTGTTPPRRPASPPLTPSATAATLSIPVGMAGDISVTTITSWSIPGDIGVQAIFSQYVTVNINKCGG